MKEKYSIIALLGIGAILVIVWLSRRSSGGAGVIPPEVATVPDAPAGYPNSAPLNMGAITIGGSPINLTYNQLPGGQNSIPQIQVRSVTPMGGTDCSCGEKSDCADSAGDPVSVKAVSPGLLAKSAANFAGFTGKYLFATGTI